MIPADQAGQCGKNQHEKCHIICKSILRKIKQTYGNTHGNTGQQKKNIKNAHQACYKRWTAIWWAVFPEFDFELFCEFSCCSGKGIVCHDHGGITVIEVCTGIGFLNGFVANRMRVIFALDSILQSVFLCKNVNALVTTSLGYGNFVKSTVT